MNKELTFAQKVLQYNKTLSSIQLNLPDGFRIINPFTGVLIHLLVILKMLYKA